MRKSSTNIFQPFLTHPVIFRSKVNQVITLVFLIGPHSPISILFFQIQTFVQWAGHPFPRLAGVKRKWGWGKCVFPLFNWSVFIYKFTQFNLKSILVYLNINTYSNIYIFFN